MTDEQLYIARQEGRSYRDIASEHGLSTDSVRSRISRYNRLQQQIVALRAENQQLREQLAAKDTEDVFGHDLGKPWELEGDWIICGDVHVNTVNTEFMQRLLQVATMYLDKPRKFLLAGDFFNADAFSGYENIYPLPSFGKELQGARRFMEMTLEVFADAYIFPGNHDYRVTKKTSNAIQFEDLIRMVSHDPRIHVSHWGHAVIKSKRGDWRVTHGSEYSVNQLVVAEQLALKHGQNVISWHEHHTAIGMDRFKKHVIVNGGGMFDAGSLAYTQLEDNKKPKMANGFVMLKGGYPYLFNDHWTDWTFWLGEQASAVARKAA